MKAFWFLLSFSFIVAAKPSVEGFVYHLKKRSDKSALYALYFKNRPLEEKAKLFSQFYLNHCRFDKAIEWAKKISNKSKSSDFQTLIEAYRVSGIRPERKDKLKVSQTNSEPLEDGEIWPDEWKLLSARMDNCGQEDKVSEKSMDDGELISRLKRIVRNSNPEIPNEILYEVSPALAVENAKKKENLSFIQSLSPMKEKQLVLNDIGPYEASMSELSLSKAPEVSYFEPPFLLEDKIQIQRSETLVGKAEQGKEQ